MKTTCPTCKRRVRIRNKRIIKCPCGHVLEHNRYFGKRNEVYLLDANVFLHLVNKSQKYYSACSDLFCRTDITLATTDKIIEELPADHPVVKVYKSKPISWEILELQADADKQPSIADLSLIQVALDNQEIAGIITYDFDFKNIATSNLIKKHSSAELSKFIVGTPEEFLKRTRKF